MRSILKSLKRRTAPFRERSYDRAFAALARPCAKLLLKYRNMGSARLVQTTRALREVGCFPIRNHYYEPLFDDSKLTRPLSDDRFLPGIDLNASGQLKFIGNFNYSSELAAMNFKEKSDGAPDSFYINNVNFEGGDADFLWQFIRTVRPNKIVEIGSGHSTKLARLALLRNFAESGVKATHICIEPYEPG